MKNKSLQDRIPLFAYLAGIIDGEGCLSVYYIKRHGNIANSLYPVLIIGNTDIRLLKWLNTYFPAEKIKERIHKNKNAKPSYTYRNRNKKMLIEILKGTIPYLVLKQKQAKLLLNFLLQPVNRKGIRITKLQIKSRYMLRDKIRRLNKRGINAK